MLELFGLIMASSMGVLLVPAVRDVVYAAVVVSDCDECGFNDLGKLLFGGLIAAIVVGIAISILYRRVKNRSEETSDFVSIRSAHKKQ